MPPEGGVHSIGALDLLGGAVLRADIADQERTGFRYHYSLFQAEYSRNLLFTSGQRMDRVFGALIDRVRGPLDLRTVKTLFGRRQRPRRHKGQPRAPVVEVSLDPVTYCTTFLCACGIDS